MALFGNKKTKPVAPKQQGQQQQQEALDPNYKPKGFFHIGKPFGYVPQEVDAAIEKYNALMQKQKTIIFKMKDENAALKAEVQKLENELQNMQLELSFATIPAVSDIQEQHILERFEQSFKNEPVGGAVTTDVRQAQQRTALTRQAPVVTSQPTQAARAQKVIQATSADEEVYDVEALLHDMEETEVHQLEVVGEDDKYEDTAAYDLPLGGRQGNVLEVAGEDESYSGQEEVFDVPIGQQQAQRSPQQQQRQAAKIQPVDDFAEKFKF